MSDPRLQSLHLEGHARRDQFRAARQAIHAACGNHTLISDPSRAPVPDDLLDAPTVAPPAEGAVLAGRFTFYLKDGPDVYPLHMGMNSVGRLPDNDVVIRDECVSRRHCAVVVHTNLCCEVYDVASKNGTLVNGKRIGGPTKLQSGDQLLLCNHKLTFHMTDVLPEPSAVAG
ncbi:MAG: FHA domain-containing protein [Gemmataceae bacterium]